MPIIHYNEKLLPPLCSRSHSRQSGCREEQRQNNQTCFLLLRSTGVHWGGQENKSVPGSSVMDVTMGYYEQQRQEAPHSGSLLHGSGSRSFLCAPGILAGLPQASCAGLNGEWSERRQWSSVLARSCVWKTEMHESARGTRPLGEPGQEETWPLPPAKSQNNKLTRRAMDAEKAYQVPTWKPVSVLPMCLWGAARIQGN